jgi:hypothetical protein
MNKIYDKLLLALALLVLLGSLAFYIIKPGAGGSVPSAGSIQLMDHPYVATSISTDDMASATWPQPDEQSTGWVYDVFTPPKIYLDENGRFVNEGRKPPVPFGIYVASLERESYRIQLEGYIEEDPMDASKILILLYDEEKQRSVRARVGQVKDASAFEVLDFKIERLRDKNGNPYKNEYATILDQRTQQQVVLRNDERLYNNSVTVQIRSEQNPELNLQVSEVGASFETPAGQFVIEEINIEEMAILVKKLARGDGEDEIKRLTASDLSKTRVPESVETPVANETSIKAFDPLF